MDVSIVMVDTHAMMILLGVSLSKMQTIVYWKMEQLTHLIIWVVPQAALEIYLHVLVRPLRPLHLLVRPLRPLHVSTEHHSRVHTHPVAVPIII
jgi:hypothetical protein